MTAYPAPTSHGATLKGWDRTCFYASLMRSCRVIITATRGPRPTGNLPGFDLDEPLHHRAQLGFHIVHAQANKRRAWDAHVIRLFEALCTCEQVLQ